MRCLSAAVNVRNDTSEVAASTGIKISDVSSLWYETLGW